MAPILSLRIASDMINSYTTWSNFISYSSTFPTTMETTSEFAFTASTPSTTSTLQSSDTTASPTPFLHEISPTLPLPTSFKIDENRGTGGRNHLWVYFVIIPILVLMIGLSLFSVYKCLTTEVVRAPGQVSNTNQPTLLLEELEKGEGQKWGEDEELEKDPTKEEVGGMRCNEIGPSRTSECEEEDPESQRVADSNDD